MYFVFVDSVFEREWFHSMSIQFLHVDAGGARPAQRGSAGKRRHSGDRRRRSRVSVDYPRPAASAHQHHPARLLRRVVAVRRRRRTCCPSRSAIPAVVGARDGRGGRRLGWPDVDAKLVGSTLPRVRSVDGRRQQRRWIVVDGRPERNRVRPSTSPVSGLFVRHERRTSSN